MGESKIPAKCDECGTKGPPRKQAAREGWRSSRHRNRRSIWVCPTCVRRIQEDTEARNRVLEAGTEALEKAAGANDAAG